MAPTKGGKPSPAKGGKGGSSSSKSGPSKSGSSSSKSKSSGSASKGRTHSSVVKANATQQKPKSMTHGPQKKKRRIYTEKELNIPSLNGIVPAGVQKPKGVKKGKTFVDDKESMMAILAMVQAEKEGNIESKMIRARQMEEIREARRAEQEKRETSRRQKLDETKEKIRKSNRSKARAAEGEVEKEPSADKPKKKRVSFG